MIRLRLSQLRIGVAIAALLLSAVQIASALDASKFPKPEGYVSDFARVLDTASKAELERYCATVEQSTGAQIAVVTIPSLEGDPIEDFTNDLFRHWGVGKKGQDNGVMLLLAIRDRKSRIEVGYGLEPILPDGFVGSVLREMAPSLREQNYGQALLAGTAEIGAQIAKAKGVTLTRTLPRRAAPPQSNGPDIPWPLILIGIIILFSVLGRGRGGGGFLTGMMLGNILGQSRYRGGGSWGGGGFGGSDGGSGGFGGFGGGDSGGGGASSSW